MPTSARVEFGVHLSSFIGGHGTGRLGAFPCAVCLCVFFCARALVYERVHIRSKLLSATCARLYRKRSQLLLHGLLECLASFTSNKAPQEIQFIMYMNGI